MEVGFARRAERLLVAGGLDVEYHESDAAHHIDPAHVPAGDRLGRTRTLGAVRAAQDREHLPMCRDAAGL